MKIEFKNNVPHITPENYEEEDQLFNWYEKQKHKRVDSVISLEWVPRAVANVDTGFGQSNIPDVIKSVCQQCGKPNDMNYEICSICINECRR